MTIDMKRFCKVNGVLAVSLSTVMVFGSVPVSVFASEVGEVESLESVQGDVLNSGVSVDLIGSVEDARSRTNDIGQTFISFRITEDINELGVADVIEVRWYDKDGKKLKESLSHYTKFLTPVERGDVVGNNPIGSKVGFGDKVPAGYYTLSYVNKDIARAEVRVVKMKSLDLNKRDVSVGKGEKFSLKASFNPVDAKGSVRWVSGDSKVAKVDLKGNVTGVGTGKTTVTAKVGSHSAVCEVSVVDNSEVVTVTSEQELVNALDSSLFGSVKTINIGGNIDILSEVVVNKEVNIVNGSSGSKGVDGYTLTMRDGGCISVLSDNVGISGLNIVDENKNDAAIKISGSNVSISNNNIKTSNVAIKVADGSNIDLKGNKIEAENAGIVVESGKDVVIKDNSVVGKGDSTSGIVIGSNAGSVVVEENKIEDVKDEVVNLKPEAINKVPVIDGSDVVVKVGDKLDVMSLVRASDYEDGDLTDKIEVVKNDVDTAKVGIYEVVYKVVDSQGASCIKSIKVTVENNVEIPKDDVDQEVTKPIEPIKPVKPDNSNNPQTSDASMLGYVGLGLVSIAGIFTNKRKRR